MEGLGFRAIARFLKVSHVSVYRWIKSFGKQIEEIKRNTPPEIVELDEMHTHVLKKKLLLDMAWC